jgi:hypothetical protein
MQEDQIKMMSTKILCHSDAEQQVQMKTLRDTASKLDKKR